MRLEWLDRESKLSLLCESKLTSVSLAMAYRPCLAATSDKDDLMLCELIAEAYTQQSADGGDPATALLVGEKQGTAPDAHDRIGEVGAQYQQDDSASWAQGVYPYLLSMSSCQCKNIIELSNISRVDSSQRINIRFLALVSYIIFHRRIFWKILIF